MGVPTNSRAAVSLRLAGATYQEIADTLGYANEISARNSVERYLALQSEGDVEGRRRLRAEAGARLERLIRSVWPKALDANDPEHLQAIRVATNLIDRHIRLLGLDVPQEMIIHSPVASEIEAWVGAVLAMRKEAQAVEEAVVIDAEFA